MVHKPSLTFLGELPEVPSAEEVIVVLSRALQRFLSSTPFEMTKTQGWIIVDHWFSVDERNQNCLKYDRFVNEESEMTDEEFASSEDMGPSADEYFEISASSTMKAIINRAFVGYARNGRPSRTMMTEKDKEIETQLLFHLA